MEFGRRVEKVFVFYRLLFTVGNELSIVVRW